MITNAENMQKVLSSQNTLITAQRRLDAKQDEVLSGQRMTNEMLRKIDTTISALSTNSSAASSCSTVPAYPEHTIPLYPESPARYATPHKSAFASILPAHANVTVIAGNHVINNINKVTNNTKSHQMETINTINSYNTYKPPVALSNTKGLLFRVSRQPAFLNLLTLRIGNRGRRQRPFIRQDIS